MLNQKEQLSPNELLAIIVAVFGALGFLLWGIGFISPANITLQWIGGSIVALVAFLATFLSRWLK